MLFSSQEAKETGTVVSVVEEEQSSPSQSVAPSPIPEKDMKEFEEKVAKSTAAELSAAAAKVEPAPPVVAASTIDKSRIEP